MSTGAPRFKKTIQHNNVEKRVMDVVGMSKCGAICATRFIPDRRVSLRSTAIHEYYTLTQVDVDYLMALTEYEKLLLPQRECPPQTHCRIRQSNRCRTRILG